MARLYIANVSRQRRKIYYRLDFNQKGEKDLQAQFRPARSQDVEPGRQQMIGSPDFHPTQVEDIVQQLSRYGMIAVVETGSQREIAPLVFNVEKPVPAAIIERVMDNNRRILTEQGRVRRRRAAVGVNSLVTQHVAEMLARNGVDPEEARSPDIDVGIEQLEQANPDDKRIEEGFRLREGQGEAPSGGKVTGRAPGRAGRKLNLRGSGN